MVLRRRIFYRGICCSVVVIYSRLLSGAPFLLEVAPAKFYFPLEDECSE
jgi:hypothetical protein